MLGYWFCSCTRMPGACVLCCSVLSRLKSIDIVLGHKLTLPVLAVDVVRCSLNARECLLFISLFPLAARLLVASVREEISAARSSPMDLLCLVGQTVELQITTWYAQLSETLRIGWLKFQGRPIMCNCSTHVPLCSKNVSQQKMGFGLSIANRNALLSHLEGCVDVTKPVEQCSHVCENKVSEHNRSLSESKEETVGACNGVPYNPPIVCSSVIEKPVWPIG